MYHALFAPSCLDGIFLTESNLQTVHWKSGHKQRCLPSSISQDASEPSNSKTLREVQEGKGNQCFVLKSFFNDMILEKR